jgi:hypothetical protein
LFLYVDFLCSLVGNAHVVKMSLQGLYHCYVSLHNASQPQTISLCVLLKPYLPTLYVEEQVRECVCINQQIFMTTQNQVGW